MMSQMTSAHWKLFFLIWMGLRLRNLSSLEDIEEEYPKWKNKACKRVF